MTRLASILLAALILAPYSLVAPFATTPFPPLVNPVSVELLSPIAGSTVSNVITLSASATSLAGPIVRVEFYCDGGRIATVTNRPPPPGMFEVQ